MKKVTKKEYHDSFMKKDAVMTIKRDVNGLSSCFWKLRNSEAIIAKSVESLNDEEGIEENYYITL